MPPPMIRTYPPRRPVPPPPDMPPYVGLDAPTPLYGDIARALLASGEYSPEARRILEQIPITSDPNGPAEAKIGDAPGILGFYRRQRYSFIPVPEFIYVAPGQDDPWRTLRHEYAHALNRHVVPTSEPGSFSLPWQSREFSSRMARDLDLMNRSPEAWMPLPDFPGVFGNSPWEGEWFKGGQWGGPNEYYASVPEQGPSQIPQAMRRYYPFFDYTPSEAERFRRDRPPLVKQLRGR